MQTPFHSDQSGDGVKPAHRLESASKNRARNLLIACFFVEAWLIFLHIQLALHSTPTVRALGQAFDMTRESSIATYWSCLLALGTGLACFFVASLLRQNGASGLRYRGWIFAGIVFVCVSVDDAIAFHEKIGAITSLGLMHSLNYPSYPWHVTVAPIVGAGLLLAALVIWRDVRKVRGLTATLLLALGCFAVALGLDFMEGITEMAALESVVPAVEVDYLPIMMLTEEGLEMVGTTMILYVVFSYLMLLMRDANKRWLPVVDPSARLQSEPELDWTPASSSCMTTEESR
jgi:hypothetical protein